MLFHCLSLLRGNNWCLPQLLQTSVHLKKWLRFKKSTLHILWRGCKDYVRLEHFFFFFCFTWVIVEDIVQQDVVKSCRSCRVVIREKRIEAVTAVWAGVISGGWALIVWVLIFDPDLMLLRLKCLSSHCKARPKDKTSTLLFICTWSLRLILNTALLM